MYLQSICHSCHCYHHMIIVIRDSRVLRGMVPRPRAEDPLLCPDLDVLPAAQAGNLPTHYVLDMSCQLNQSTNYHPPHPPHVVVV